MPRGFRRDHWSARRRVVPVPLSVRMNVGTLGDFPEDYARWVAAVKLLGGVPVVWPKQLAPTSLAGKPAARYTSATYAKLFNAGKISPRIPQSATPTGYVYVLAPTDAVKAAIDLAKLTKSEEAALPKESLLDRVLPGASAYVKWGAIGLVAAAAIGLARGSGGRR